MANLTTFKLSDGSLVIVEADEPPKKKGERRAGMKDQMDTLKKFLDLGKDKTPVNLEARILPVALALDSIRKKINEVVKETDEVILEAGLKFIGEAGVILSKVGTEANIKITLKWKSTSTG